VCYNGIVRLRHEGRAQMKTQKMNIKLYWSKTLNKWVTIPEGA